MALRRMHFERRMSDAEALMWYLEKDPSLRASFANVTMLDRPPDVARLRRRLLHAVEVVPRLRQRVVSSPLRLAPPEWEDDPEFDLDFHVRRMAIPAPGTDRQLFDLAVLLAEDPFDRARPLWQFVVVEGLQGGRAALLQKLHHTITDGEGGVRLSALFLDLERDPDDAARSDALAHDPELELERASTPLDVLRDTVAYRTRRQLALGGRVLAGAAAAAARPGSLPRVAGDVVETGRSVARQLLVTESRRSPLWTGRSLKRRMEALSVPLDDAKRAAKNLGGTLNDLFVTAVAGAAGAYHAEKGAPVGELRMAMPVSTRTDGSTGRNAFSPTRVLVPTGPGDPVARFDEVVGRLGATKRERALGIVEDLAGLMALLPTAVLVRFARQQVHTVDFTTSNVRGAPVDLYVAGAHILANYPLGPTGATALNVTLLSYRGSLDMGIHADTAAIDDTDLMKRCLALAFEELLDAAS